MRILVLILKIESIFCCIMYSYYSQLTLRLNGSTKTQFMTGGFNEKNQLVLNDLFSRKWQLKLAHEIVLSKRKKFIHKSYFLAEIKNKMLPPHKFSYLGHNQPVSETVSYYLYQDVFKPPIQYRLLLNSPSSYLAS